MHTTLHNYTKVSVALYLFGSAWAPPMFSWAPLLLASEWVNFEVNSVFIRILMVPTLSIFSHLSTPISFQKLHVAT